MNLIHRIKLSALYGKGIYIVSSSYSLPAAAVCFFKPWTAPSCIILKIASIPVIWYLFKSLQNKHTIYFYLNLGISRKEYFTIPLVVEFVCFILLLSLSISIGNVIR